ncbi:hypothetical protein jhhlp_001777 [Lomentospora prolificans]|uniref:Inactive metallocarboxypeptidase ECM14 n=1 Tax=Lomentospora prolificans TaxID=41688 RepID=A0A2N3NGN5_9PEZI|nr:hypothetical protein jhhlp_001777 [Lomentospora prolificans]
MQLLRIGIFYLFSFALATEQGSSVGRPGRLAASTSSKRFASVARDGRDHTNPFLKRLRDYFVEFVFGTPTSRIDTRPIGRNILAAYGNDVVVRFNVTDSREEEAISEAVERLFKDVWSHSPNSIDIRMHRDDVAPFLSLLPESLHSSYSILIADLAARVRDTYPTNYLSDGYIDVFEKTSSIRGPLLPTYGDNIFFEDYQPLSVIRRWARLMEALFPSLVEMITVGVSYEGRDILALKIGARSQADDDSPRKTIVVTGGLHAREWISTTTANYVAWSFITHYRKDPIVTKFLEKFELIVIPTLNPDGFDYTWQVDRLWRKTRQHTTFRFCRGIDLDRAFGYQWEPSGDPCSEFYGGDEAFEATEAQQLAAFVQSYIGRGAQIMGLIDLHSYSQQVLFPYSFSCAEEPPNLENMEELAAGLAKAIRLTSGEAYAVRPACEGAVASETKTSHINSARIEVGGGSAIDWFSHELLARYSYQIRLRDTGSYGFLLPKEYIIPTGEEIFNAFRYLADFLLGNNGIESIDTNAVLHEDPSSLSQIPEESVLEQAGQTGSFRSHELRR